MTSQDSECNAPDQTDDDLRAIWARENSDRLADMVTKFQTGLATLADDLTDFKNVQGIDEFLSALWAMRAQTRRFQSSISSLTEAAAEAEARRAAETQRHAEMLRLANSRYTVRGIQK